MHSNVLMHHSLDKSMAFLLANKLASRTLLSTQLQRLFNDAYQADPVRQSYLPLQFTRTLVPAMKSTSISPRNERDSTT